MSSTACCTVEADLSTAVHPTDGGGVSDHVFALAHLLGIQLAPRVPNLADRKLHAFGSASEWPAPAPFIDGRPDEKLIAAQRDDVLRLTTSVRTGTVRASLMLKRLGAHRAMRAMPGRMAWHWRCARSSASSGPSTPWTGWSGPLSAGKPQRS